ncbi:MAG: heparinase II/III family protein [Lentisphaeria bacterium]|nr:heparinase II/III family protein [Lentisphaeria bacterium]
MNNAYLCRLLFGALLLLLGPRMTAQGVGVLSLGDFETGTWPGLVQSTEQAHSGKAAGKWSNLAKTRRIDIPNIPADWSGYDRLEFWLHSAQANGQRLTLVCNSENPKTKGWDYFFHHFKIDWEGWKHFSLTLGTDIRPTRSPLGWQAIGYCSFNASGWQIKQLPGTVLHFDEVRLVKRPLHVRAESLGRSYDGQRWTEQWSLEITNRLEVSCKIEIREAPEQDEGVLLTTNLPRTLTVPPGEVVQTVVELTSGGANAEKLLPLSRHEKALEIVVEAAPIQPMRVLTSLSIPLPTRTHPFLFGDASVYQRALKRAETHDWARDQVDSLVRASEAILKNPLHIPDEGGQWSHHYVCKTCGSRLSHRGAKHICGKCGKEYTGWPYDQVIIAGIHHRNWRDVWTLGMGYVFTEREEFAMRARENLLAYADKYTSFPLHDSRGNKSRSGARIAAQTLDESVSIIRTAWGYDLVYDSAVWSAEDRSKVENLFFREVAKTIRRNNAGISNWQSWHNAGVAAIGFCLQDPELASHALFGRSGLEFQLKKSILPDGFWYEGTAAYHYYALEALRWTVEAAHQAGFDFWQRPEFLSLYEAPLAYTFPDLTFPAINDSDIFSITGRSQLYEHAYARSGQRSFLRVARHGNRRSIEALLWGDEVLPAAPEASSKSRVFSGLGAIVLRDGTGSDQLYAHLDYGAHGGGHGHPDKLALTLFGLGRQLAPDPGRLAYGAPMQGTWYRTTFAHNTVVVDEKNQKRTTGHLEFHHFSPQMSVAVGTGGGAYPGVTLKRTVALTHGLVIDVFEVASEEEHTYDWMYHGFGGLKPGMAVNPVPEGLGKAVGYRHAKKVVAAGGDNTWHVDFIQDIARVRLHLLGETGSTLFFGEGMANNPPAPCPFVMVRRKAGSTRFVAVMDVFRDKPRVSGLEMLSTDNGLALQIDMGPSRLGVLLGGAGHAQTVFGLQTDAKYLCAELAP